MPVAACLAFVLACALAAAGHRAGRSPHARMSAGAMPLTFPHAAHAGYSCVMCHHDAGVARFDAWPHRNCVDCHVLTPRLSASAEATFHEFCESCHIRERAQTSSVAMRGAGGPIRECASCHVGHRGSTFVLH